MTDDVLFLSGDQVSHNSAGLGTQDPAAARAADGARG